MISYELKDLFRAIKSECIFMNRLSDKLNDRNDKLDHRADALQMIRDYEREFDLSKDMKKFLIRRVTRVCFPPVK